MKRLALMVGLATLSVLFATTLLYAQSSGSESPGPGYGYGYGIGPGMMGPG